LPQIINIWRGEMSWVGPRALPINERQRNEDEDVPDSAVPGFDLRCSVRPGLTGIAQVFAPRDVPRRQKFRYDAFYIRRQSAWLDLRLIAISVWISLRLRWESRAAKVKTRGRGRRTV
jgi:lipopolysaccharide/colanic/teichoic acid biosynthesis glycosyltransferase